MDLFLIDTGERVFDRRRRDTERDLERFLDLGGVQRFLGGERDRLLAGDLDFDRRRGGGDLDFDRRRGGGDLDFDRRRGRGDLDFDRRRGGGDLDLVRLREFLDLERRLRLRERERDLLVLRVERDRDRRDLAGGDFLRRDTEGLLERLPLARLAGDLDLDRRSCRLDLEVERLALTERDLERLLAAPPRRGDLLREPLVPPRDRDLDLRFLPGDLDTDRDLRPLRFGDLEDFLLLLRGLLWRFGETDIDSLRRLGLLDFLGDFDAFFLGEGELDFVRSFAVTDGEGDFL